MCAAITQDSPRKLTASLSDLLSSDAALAWEPWEGKHKAYAATDMEITSGTKVFLHLTSKCSQVCLFFLSSDMLTRLKNRGSFPAALAHRPKAATAPRAQ